MSERTPPTESELVEFVRSIDVPAPPELHRRIDALVAASRPEGERTSHRSRAARCGWVSRRAWRLAVVAAVLVIASLAGGGSALTLRTAVALTLRPATMPAPAQDAQHDGTLAADVEESRSHTGKTASAGARPASATDSVDGRTVTTVFYARGHRRFGYAIVAGQPRRASAAGSR